MNIKLDLKKDKTSNIAFIARLENSGVLKNVTFQDPIVVATQEHGEGGVSGASVAVAVGKLVGGSIENVHVKGGTVSASVGASSTGDAGGLAGTAQSGSISESDGNTSVSGSAFAVLGGICGSVTGDNVVLTSVSYEGNVPLAGATSNENGITIDYGALKVTEKNAVRTAVIDGAYKAAGEVKILSNVTVSSVTLNRTFNEDRISTLYVPFEIAAADVIGAKVYKFKTVVWNEEVRRWKFKVTTTETVKPNTPYVLLPTATEVSFDIADHVTLNTTTEGEDASNGQWDFVGTYSYIDFVLDNDNPVYLFADQARDGVKLGEFTRIATGAFTNPMRAYLVYHRNYSAPKSANGNLGGNILLPDELDIEIEDENGIVVETGRLNTVTGEVRMDRWFDLKGRRLNSKPTVKGTYYKNGKKAII
ncbi:MAG: hypothetical protein J6S87_05155, partial [Bacteroidales bacterium]|nr:hypothetical protein [Bacteroidales bacterium]